MVTRDDLRRLIEGLPEDDLDELYAELKSRVTHDQARLRSPRPLRSEDIILAEAIMPDDETADDLITTVRRWRREGGYA